MKNNNEIRGTRIIKCKWHYFRHFRKERDLLIQLAIDVIKYKVTSTEARVPIEQVCKNIMNLKNIGISNKEILKELTR